MAEAPGNRQLAEKSFIIGPAHPPNDPNEEEVTYELKQQRPIDDEIHIEKSDTGDTVGKLFYQATWVYNKRSFLEDLKESMEAER